MTYKKIVEGMVERESKQWVEELLKENGIEGYIFSEGVKLENEKEHDQFSWEVELRVYVEGEGKTLIVGGVADDIGIYKSVIWLAEPWRSWRDIIWMAVKDTRDCLGITEFKIA